MLRPPPRPARPSVRPGARPRSLGTLLRSGLTLALGLGLAGSVMAVPAQAQVEVDQIYAAPAGAAYTVTGRGYGHGTGMSQYGARGAARQGLSHQQITDFYYPGTAMGRATGPIRVRLSADTDRILEVRPRSGLRFLVVGTTRTAVLPASLAGQRVSLWRARHVTGGTRVEGLTGSTWRPHASGVLKGTVGFRAAGPVTLRTGSVERAYRGALWLVNGTTVNRLGLQNYLRGVVPREMPATWEPAAVRSQAIAARSYAAWERSTAGSRGWDSCDTTSCQVYGGLAAEHPASNAAVAATAGQVRTHQGKPAFTQFSSSNGGWTNRGSMPFLTARQDPYDAAGGSNPNHRWSTTLTKARIEGSYPALGTLRSIQVTQRSGNGEWNGRVLRMVLKGSRGDVTLTGPQFRFRFGLKSDWFAFS